MTIQGWRQDMNKNKNTWPYKQTQKPGSGGVALRAATRPEKHNWGGETGHE